MNITKTQKDGYTLISVENDAGMLLRLTSLGAGIREIIVPDKNGQRQTVTLCPVDEEVYKSGYHGKTIGRTSGRINGARFTVDGNTAVLEKNNCGEDNLHGGAAGLHAQSFEYDIKETENGVDVVFAYLSPHGEGGYLGEVKITVIYRIYGGQNRFDIIFEGAPSQKTLLNLTNHVYLNMGGGLSESVLSQTLYLNASHVGRLNERLIVEELVPVSEEFDFRTPHKIGEHIAADSVQQYTKGYDHPFFLKESGLDKTACALQSDKSGIRLEIRTTYPCVVLYTDNYADSSVEVYRGRYDEQYLAACLECQYHPDGVHQSPESCGIVSPEKPYREVIEYRFKLV